MTEDDRFTWKTVHGWHTNAFLVVMNGLDKKNKRLKQEKEQLMQDWIKVFLSAKNEQRKLKEKNKQLKQINQEVIELILDGIVEMHDGKRDYAEKLLNKAIELIK